MSLVSLPGALWVPVFSPPNQGTAAAPATANITLTVVNDAAIFIGNIVTSDGGSHTINTTGSSSIGWRTSTCVFASGTTIVKVGLAPVSTTLGPPARAEHASNVIAFDVSASFTGGTSGITATAWQTSVPTAGSKTIANGDFIAMAVQMTAKGGSDSIQVANTGAAVMQRPTTTQVSASAYGSFGGMPNCIITFADGAIGYFYGSIVFSTLTNRAWNNSAATKEYGQLFQLPFPCKVHGLIGFCLTAAGTADFSVALYSNPLGTPVAEKTIAVDANSFTATGRLATFMFASPYSARAEEKIVAAYKPGASNMTTYYRTLASAGHRIADPWGTNGYGVGRDAGAFSDANSGLDHYYIGLLVGAFEHGVNPQYALGI